MDGTVGRESGKSVRALAKALEERTADGAFWDERCTTVAAHEILHRGGKREKKHRENVDAVAGDADSGIL